MEGKERKVRLVRYLLGAFFLLLFFKIFYLQVLNYGFYKQMSDKNRIRLLPQPAPRGVIKDRWGKALALNRASFTVSVIPYEVKNLNHTLSLLSKILKMDYQQLSQKVEEAGFKSFRPVKLQQDLDFNTLSQIAEQSEELGGVIYQVEPIRQYPKQNWASHLLGYVSEISPEELERFANLNLRPGVYIGKDGVEKKYDEYLRGKEGCNFLEVTASGRVLGPLPDKKPEEPLPGLELILTIDSQLEAIAESALSNYPAGAIVALDPQSGEILCAASYPGFDANRFVSSLTPEQWKQISTAPNFPLIDRCFQSSYPPGSIAKIIAAGAALESGLIHKETRFAPCPGYYTFGKRTFKCWKPEGHGQLNLIEAIAQSCDVYFYQVGLRTGIERISNCAMNCGWGKKLGVDLPDENSGLVPTLQYYDRKYGLGKWPKSLVLNLVIGQGEYLTTPLQLAAFYAAVGNGGIMYRPFLVKEIVSPSQRLVTTKNIIRQLPFSAKTLEILNQGLQEVVQGPYGTGQLAKIEGIKVAGKTGTAQNPFGLEHAWFVGYAPADYPKIAVAVILENTGHGGEFAAPVAKKIMEAYLKREVEMVQK